VLELSELLRHVVEQRASDLHLKAGSYPMMRVRGALMPATEDKRLDHDDMVSIALWRTIVVGSALSEIKRNR